MIFCTVYGGSTRFFFLKRTIFFALFRIEVRHTYKYPTTLETSIIWSDEQSLNTYINSALIFNNFTLILWCFHNEKKISLYQISSITTSLNEGRSDHLVAKFWCRYRSTILRYRGNSRNYTSQLVYGRLRKF